MKEDFEIFKGKTLSNLFEDIYTNQLQKKVKIDAFIKETQKKIETKEDLQYLIPIINDMMKESVKNDEHLIKLAQIVQKIMATNKKEGDGSGNALLSDEEKKQILTELKDIKSAVDTEEFNHEMENLKKEFDI